MSYESPLAGVLQYIVKTPLICYSVELLHTLQYNPPSHHSSVYVGIRSCPLIRRQLQYVLSDMTSGGQELQHTCNARLPTRVVSDNVTNGTLKCSSHYYT